jgi:ABC-type uncharacterized transport system ATPase subunit
VITIHSPSDALKRGIGMLHQDPLDFPPMKVIDNLLIGQEADFFQISASKPLILRNWPINSVFLLIQKPMSKD